MAITTARTCLAVLVTATALVLSACSSSGSGSTSKPAQSASSSKAPVSAPAPATTASSSAAAPAASGPVTVNKPFADKAIGESGTVLAYIRNFAVSPATKAKYSLLQDDEVVLVEVKVTSSKKYYDSFGADSFNLVGDDGEENAANNTTVGPDMTKAGHAPLQDASDGASKTGWIAFPLDKGSKKLTLRYAVDAATTSDGKSVPAVTVNVPLV